MAWVVSFLSLSEFGRVREKCSAQAWRPWAAPWTSSGVTYKRGRSVWVAPTEYLDMELGLPCFYVFNCSDQMNYQTMADIFRGLSRRGAWGCFDEFNRIPIEVLRRKAATQVKIILDATIRFADPENRVGVACSTRSGHHRSRSATTTFLGRKTWPVPTCGFYITMNPGYAGRTEFRRKRASTV